MDGQYRYYIDSAYQTPQEMDIRYGRDRAAVLRQHLDAQGNTQGSWGPGAGRAKYDLGQTIAPPVPDGMREGTFIHGSSNLLREYGFPDRNGFDSNNYPLQEIPMSRAAPAGPPKNVAEMMALFARGLG